VKLSFLLGLDMLRYFKFTYDFDAADGAPHGRMLYEFRDSQRADYTKLGAPFALHLGGTPIAGDG
jgi:hypothetical protein